MENRCVIACILNDEEHKHLLDINKRVYSSNGLAPTLTTVCGGGARKDSGRSSRKNTKTYTA